MLTEPTPLNGTMRPNMRSGELTSHKIPTGVIRVWVSIRGHENLGVMMHMLVSSSMVADLIRTSSSLSFDCLFDEVISLIARTSSKENTNHATHD